jgi:hypothetical protein
VTITNLEWDSNLLFYDSNPGTDFLGVHTPRNALQPPPQSHLTLPPKSFCTPSNYTYFDLIFSYLVNILITKLFILSKLLILWSQMTPCRPRKHVLLNIFPGLSGRCHQAPAKASSTPPPIFIHPLNENMKIRLWPQLRFNRRPWTAWDNIAFKQCLAACPTHRLY